MNREKLINRQLKQRYAEDAMKTQEDEARGKIRPFQRRKSLTCILLGLRGTGEAVPGSRTAHTERGPT